MKKIIVLLFAGLLLSGCAQRGLVFPKSSEVKHLSFLELEDSAFVSKLNGSFVITYGRERSYGQFRKGKKHGRWLSWDLGYPNGLYIETYRHGKKHGYCIDGEGTGYYKNDKKEGLWEGNNDYGPYHGYYKKGKKDGVWEYYQDKILINRNVYQNDSLLESEYLPGTLELRKLK